MSIGYQETAKIYQFPRRPLAAAERRREGLQPADIAAARLPVVETGGSWYHEAALKDADRNRKP